MTTPPGPPPPPPGWYPDPSGAAGQRYFDGSRWSENRAPAVPEPLLRVVLDDDDGVIGFGDDPDVRTAPLGVVGGAVVGVLTGLSPR